MVAVSGTRIDKTLPKAEWVERTPAAGSVLTDPIIHLSLRATDNRGVQRVEFYVEGRFLGVGAVQATTSATSIHRLSFDMRGYESNGFVNVWARVVPVEGPGTTKQLGVLTFDADQLATLEILSPAPDAALSAPFDVVVRAIPPTGDAFAATDPLVLSDDNGMFAALDTPVNNGDGTYTFTVSTIIGSSQNFALRVEMNTLSGSNNLERTQGNPWADFAPATTITAGVSISDATLDVGQVATVTPTVSGITSGTAIVSFDRQGDGSYEYVQTGVSPFTVAYTSTDAPTLSTLTATLKVDDPLGDAPSQTATVVVTVTPLVGDVTAPVTSFVSPAAASTILGVQNVEANATDAVGVVAVIFDINGVEQPEVAVSPSSTNTNKTLALDTRLYANGSITIGVKARDAAGNVSARATRSFTIDNAAASPGTPPTVYTTITTVKVADSYVAGDWISPIGIAPDGAGSLKDPRGVVPAARFSNLWARSQAGNWSYIQTEQFKTWAADGSLKHCTGHFKIPSGYVMGEKIDIVVGLDDGPPSEPTWSALTGSDAGGTLEVDVSVWQPKVYAVFFNGAAAVGDVIRIRCSDSQGEQSYQRTVRSNRSLGAVLFDLALELTMTAGSRFRAIKDPAAKMLPPPPDGAADPGVNDWTWTVRQSFNAGIAQTEGTRYNIGAANSFPPIIPNGWPAAPVTSAYGAQQYVPNANPYFGFYVWPAWRAGDPEDFTCVVEITRASGSTLVLRTGPLATDATTSGQPHVVQTPVARANHTLTFAAAALTPRSPYFTGRNVRQVERKILIPGTTVDIRMLVSFDNTGGQIDHQLVFENSRMFSGARDCWYDVTAIRVLGVQQLDSAAKLAAHRDLHHYIRKVWSWTRTKPWFSIDPSALMRTDLIGAFKTNPSDDNLDSLRIFTLGCSPASQGSSFHGGDLLKINPVLNAARGGFQNDFMNKPLWTGPIAYDGTGGARTGIALHDIWGAVYLQSNLATHWEHLVAIADNGWGNHPWYVRDERPVAAGAVDNRDTVDADQTDAPPHIFKHPINSLMFDGPESATTSRGKAMIIGNAHDNGIRGFQPYEAGRKFVPNCQIFSLYQGSAQGSYSWASHPTPSHSPPHAAKIPYMTRPEARFLDALEMWAWANYTVYCGPAGIKTGGQVYDADHRASWNIVNGVRGFSWPWRDVCHAAALMWEGHPRREKWRRAAADGADYFRKLAQNQWGGMFHTQSAINSNNWATAIIPQKAGNIQRTWNSTTLNPEGHDLFKNAYCTQVATFCHQAEITDLSDALTLGTYWHRALDDASQVPGYQWWHLWGLWNNWPIDLADAVVQINLQNSTQAATFTVGDLITVSTSGFAGTVFRVSGAQVTISNITNWGRPLAGQTMTGPGLASGIVSSVQSGGPGFVRSANGKWGSESVVDYLTAYATAPWAFVNGVRRTTEPIGDSPFGYGSSSGYNSEIFHWKALYGVARFSTNAAQKARAQFWIDFLNARFDEQAMRVVGQNSAAYVYSLPDMRLSFALGPQHVWRAPSEIASQAW